MQCFGQNTSLLRAIRKSIFAGLAPGIPPGKIHDAVRGSLTRMLSLQDSASTRHVDWTHNVVQSKVPFCVHCFADLDHDSTRRLNNFLPLGIHILYLYIDFSESALHCTLHLFI